jgi:hypothetical protein
MKTHIQLGLSWRELGAMLATREMLKMKAIKHNPTPTGIHGCPLVADNERDLRFNMLYTAKSADCGIVGCIGGHMALILGESPEVYVARTHGRLRRLFYPFGLPVGGWEEITAKQAVKAIDNFLTTGKPMWRKAVAKAKAKKSAKRRAK